MSFILTPDRRAIALLCAAPLLVALAVVLAPITTDPLVLFGGIAFDVEPSWLPGFSTIDPNQGYTAFALGVRATLDVFSGRLPLWNPYEGLGSPLLGEMQAAALFPPTLLLALPHGQVIEQALLQIVAGIGTFLFLRRFGLSRTAALAGGILFEFNGVFAWLRNAIYNPVAFLPWLFYAVETLFVAAAAGHARHRRVGPIVTGAIAASLSLYAGFPEVVFFYCFPLSGWLALRAAALPGRRARSFLADNALLAIAALLITAPLLISFARFLAQANVGDHQDQGFKDAIIDPGGAVMYLLPYLYGPVSASSDPAIAGFWSNGGYLGFTAFVLAIGGVVTGGRRPILWWPAAWIVFAVGVSHGAPILLALFTRIPLVTDAAFARYMNAGWLFCAVILAASFVDVVPALSWDRRRRVGLTMSGIAFLILGIALALAGPTLARAWQPHQGQRVYILLSLAAAISLSMAALATIWFLRPARAAVALAGLLLAEPVFLYAVPFASSPRGAEIDRPLVEFLQRHAGLQRVAIASGTGLSPNFGSAFGISTINYDDTPVPARTVAYVQRELQPTAVPIMFRPTVNFRHDTPRMRRDEFMSHRSGYAKAGVRYILADPDFFQIGPNLLESGTRAVDLAAGEVATLILAKSSDQDAITAIRVLIGTYGGSSDGHLVARLCETGRCQAGSADLATAADNARLTLAFDPPFALTGGPYQLELSKQGGVRPVALWSKRPAPGEIARAAGLPGLDGTVPDVTFEDASNPRRLLSTRSTTVFELLESRPYASAPDCRIDASSHEHMTADCAHPSRLTRLEVAMDGWTARVNDIATAVGLVEDTFQAIELPAGHADIEFAYAPRFVRPAVWVAAAILLGLLALSIAARRRIGPDA